MSPGLGPLRGRFADLARPRSPLLEDETNASYPLAYNISISSSGLPTLWAEVTAYVDANPKVRWLVYGVSTRIFNEKWKDQRVSVLASSSGYRRYDCDHPELFDVDPGQLVLPTRPDYVNEAMSAWGYWKKAERAKDYRANFEDPDDMSKLMALVAEKCSPAESTTPRTTRTPTTSSGTSTTSTSRGQDVSPRSSNPSSR